MTALVVLVGAPGVGKGTFARLIAPSLSLKVLSAGDLLREEMKANTAIGKTVEDTSNRGELVPDHVIADLMRRQLLLHEEKGKGSGRGYILDGFPRTVGQAALLDEFALPVTAVMNIRLEEWVAVEKLVGRRVCEGCGVSFNVADIRRDGFDMPALPPPDSSVCTRGGVEGCKGGALTRRADDIPEVIRNRLRVYHEETAPLVDHYASRGLLHHFDVRKGVADAPALQEEIEQTMGGGGLSPSSSSSSYTLDSDEHRKRVNELNDSFVEARDEIEYAEESKGTTYYNEEAEAASAAVEEALTLHKAILGDLTSDAEKAEFQRETGMKMEQLRAELEVLLEDDDH